MENIKEKEIKIYQMSDNGPMLIVKTATGKIATQPLFF